MQLSAVCHVCGQTPEIVNYRGDADLTGKTVTVRCHGEESTHFLPDAPIPNLVGFGARRVPTVEFFPHSLKGDHNAT